MLMKLLSINTLSLSTVIARVRNGSQDRIQASNAHWTTLLVVLYTRLKGIVQVINEFFQSSITTVVVYNQSGQVVVIDVISTEGSFLPTYPFSAPVEGLEQSSPRHLATPLAQSYSSASGKPLLPC